MCQQSAKLQFHQKLSWSKRNFVVRWYNNTGQKRGKSEVYRVLNSQTVYILADHSKFDQISAVTFAQLGRVKIITDKLQDKKYLTKANIKEVM